MASYELRSTQGRGGFRVSGTITKVGRANDNNVVVNDPTVSRYHLNFYVRDDGSLVVENAGSQAGFLLNGQPASGPVAATHGDRLAFGSLEYMVLRDGLPPPAPTPNNVRSSANTGTVPLYEAAARINVPTAGAGSGRMKIYAVLGLLLFGMVYLGQQDEGGERGPASAQEQIGLADPLNPESYKAGRKEPLSQSEIEAEGFFRAGMRDFHNKNYTRALQLFQQARTKNPSHPEAAVYIEQAEGRIKSELGDLLKDANRSFAYLQYGRAKLQALRVLTLLADQIPAYSRQLASEALARKSDQPSLTHEETLMKLECKLTKDIEACRQAVKIIVEARNRLGEENELR